ncbi:MAG: peptidoglycan-binding protein [Magnetococcus sp. MYC-9]
MTGQEIVALAETRVGQSYVLGAKVPKNDPNWQGPWDCAELASWALFQVTGILFGTRPQNNPARADAYTGYWGEQAHAAHAIVDLQAAAGIPGSFVLREPASSLGGHIVISDGQGGTVEAHSSKRGVIRSTLSGRRWDYGIVVPGVQHSVTSPPAPITTPHSTIYRLTKPLMVGQEVAAIQTALRNHGLNPGHVDGVFGPQTRAAVIDFQKAQGLLPDGEVGQETAGALGVFGR